MHGIPRILFSTNIEARLEDDVPLGRFPGPPLGLVVIVLEVGRGVGSGPSRVQHEPTLLELVQLSQRGREDHILLDVSRRIVVLLQQQKIKTQYYFSNIFSSIASMTC